MPGARHRSQKNGWLLPGLRRHGCARNVEQVLDLLDAPNLARALLEILDHRRLLDLVAEDLGLDLARKRDVVRLRLLLFFEVLHLLLGAVDLGRGRAAGVLDLPRAASEESRDPVTRERATAVSALGIEEIGDQGTQAHVSQ